MRVPADIINFTFRSNKYKLRGVLHLPRVSRPPIVFGSHGLAATGDSPKQIALAEQCSRAGIAFFRFDHRGCGGSDGTFQDVTSLPGRVEDLAAAVDAVRSKHDLGKRTGLFGSSMGGAVSIASARTLKPWAMVTYAAPVRSRNINAAIENDPGLGKNLGPLNDPDALTFDISGHLGHLHHILIIHGDADPVVPVNHAGQIHDAAQEPKELYIQDGGDHPMNNPAHQKEFVRRATEWFGRWLKGEGHDR